MSLEFIIGTCITLAAGLFGSVTYLIAIAVKVGKLTQKIDIMGERLAEDRWHDKERIDQLVNFKDEMIQTAADLNAVTQQLQRAVDRLECRI